MRLHPCNKIFFLLMATCTHLNASTNPFTVINQKILAAINNLSSVNTGEIATAITEKIAENIAQLSVAAPFQIAK